MLVIRREISGYAETPMDGQYRRRCAALEFEGTWKEKATDWIVCRRMVVRLWAFESKRE